MNVQESMECTASVVMGLFVRTPLEVMLAPVVLVLRVIRENCVLISTNVHNHLEQTESVVSQQCVPTRPEVMSAVVHREVLVIPSTSVWLKTIVPTMTRVVAMQFALVTNVTVPLPTSGMIANVSH